MSKPAGKSVAGLHQLAEIYGIQTAYTDVMDKRRVASAEALFAALQAMGAPIHRQTDVPAALATAANDTSRQMVEPIVIAWDGVCEPIGVNLPDRASAQITVEISLEGGGTLRQQYRVDDLPAADPRGAVGWGPRRNIRFRDRLPTGYHQLAVSCGPQRAESTVISAPRRTYAGEPGERPSWGVFLPLYALRTDKTWGSGDLTGLCELLDWTASLGARTVSTLPLLAAFLDKPFEPSPYSPASRLFWNEFYLDATAAPEFALCEEARDLVASPSFERQAAALQQNDTVDYKTGMALKRRVLQLLADQCFRTVERLNHVNAFTNANLAIEDYATFRATVEKQGKTWPNWTAESRGGHISGGEYDEESRRYHLYVQFLLHEQLGGLRRRADELHARLYLDMPLGSNLSGYDVWRHRESFVMGLAGGAPPDSFFTRGQDWEFPPMHPINARRDGYRYLRASLGNILHFAGILRIDHVAGLHRLFCIPAGMDVGEGVYIRYRAEELYAVISLESHRHKALIVGEDLGTILKSGQAAMSRHALHRTHVLQYAAAPDSKPPIPTPAPFSAASVNTHDMPPFAGFWQGKDIEDRHDLGLIDEGAARQERRTRARIKRTLLSGLHRVGDDGAASQDASVVAKALMTVLASSSARLLLVNLEDLWGETQPQNVPGTMTERVNWRRKAKYSLNEMKARSAVTETLSAIDSARKRAG